MWRRATVKALGQVDPSLGAPLEGDPLLRECLADLLRVRYERIVVTAGVRAAVGPLLRDVDEVLVERPTFRGVLTAMRRERLRVRTDTWEWMIDAGADNTGAALWFTAPCRNPDGRGVDARFVAAVGAAAERGRRVVCNTAYRWFAPVPDLSEAVLTVGTLHKLAGRGARLGWVIAASGDGEMVPALAASAPSLHWQRAWAHFLIDGGAALLLRRHQQLDAARAAFFAALDMPTVASGQEGPNILIPVALPEPEAVARLAAAGVRVSPGSAFHAWQPSVRVCLTQISPAVAGQAGERVAEVLAEARSADVPRPPACAGADAGPG
ncbi:hypothetical protein ACFY1S_03505 [Micromonospora sp. NPDC000663]|uniref:hypothetical protein n=1 Tax=Micromonospora sp. NPDC000663 TaxID=3364218 RepID=UPI0036D046DC